MFCFSAHACLKLFKVLCVQVKGKLLTYLHKVLIVNLLQIDKESVCLFLVLVIYAVELQLSELRTSESPIIRIAFREKQNITQS